MVWQIIIGIVIGVGIAGVGFFLINQKSSNTTNQLKQEMEDTVSQKLIELMPQALKQANESLVQMADQKLGAEKKEIKTDLENKRSEIERLVKTIQRDLKEADKKLEETDKKRIGSFNALKTSLEEHKEFTKQLAVSTENLKKVLSNNQLRGQFGEQVAEDLLRMAGFVKGVDYNTQEQSSQGTKPDFTIFLPDGTKINVDAKFPFANLQKRAETDNREKKKEYTKLFEQDVKNKIKQVTSRDYINPEDRTVDFVILFIPNEMIFSYIYDNMNEIWQDAMSKKVVLAGPFSFTAILRMVKQAYDNFKIQQNLQETIDNIKLFTKEFIKFEDSFIKIGDRIQSLEKQYNTVNSTRMNQLRRRMDRVNLEEVEESEQQGLLE